MRLTPRISELCFMTNAVMSTLKKFYNLCIRLSADTCLRTTRRKMCNVCEKSRAVSLKTIDNFGGEGYITNQMLALKQNEC